MDYTNTTLGVLLSSKDETVKRNALSILKQLQKTNATIQQESFEVTSLSREDLESRGFNAKNVSDDTMERMARRLGEAYCESGFWDDLDYFAGVYEVPKRKCVKCKTRDANEDDLCWECS